jgi:hypothetical protein
MNQVRKTASPGSRAVMAMFAVAVLAAGFAWWWNYNRGLRALGLYGAEGAWLIRTAPVVEFLQPSPAEAIDISQAPGLINARASLLSDASYDWSAADVRQQSPLFSVRFRHKEQSIVVTFDFENQTIHASTTDGIAKLVNKTAEGWQGYLARQSARRLEPTHTAPLE